MNSLKKVFNYIFICFCVVLCSKVYAAESYNVGDKVLFGEYGGHVIEASGSDSNTVKVYLDGWNKTRDQWDEYWDNYAKSNNLSSRIDVLKKIGFIPLMNDSTDGNGGIRSGKIENNNNYSLLSQLKNSIVYTTSEKTESDVTTSGREYQYKYLKINVSNVSYDWLLKDNINFFGNKSVQTNSNLDMLNWYTLVDDVSYANCSTTVYDNYYSKDKKIIGTGNECMGLAPANISYNASTKTYSHYAATPFIGQLFIVSHNDFIVPTLTLQKSEVTLALEKCSNYSDNYRITFETNGGVNIDSVLVKGTKELTNPKRDSYLFAGWYTDSSFKNKVSSISPTPKKTDTCIAGFNDVTVYAKWNKEFKNDKLSILGDSKLLDNVSDISVELKDEIASLTDEVLKSFVAYDIVLKDKDGKSVEPGGNVKLSLLIPEGYNKNNIGVYRVEGDKLVDYKVTINGEYAEIETDHFSTYIIGEKIESKQEETPTQNSDNVVDNDANQEKDNEKEKVDNPDTGANVTLFLVIGIVLIGIGYLVIRIINKKIYTI